MGQQQLFLIVIVAIIVGLATIIAIDTMDVARTEANESAVREDIFMVLNDARVYYEEAGVMGRAHSFDGFSMDDVHSVEPSNENGTYEVSEASGKSLTIEGEGNFEGVALTATATMTSDGMEISWSE